MKRLLPKRFRSAEVIIPVVRLNGVILASAGPLRSSISLAAAAPLLERAFADKAAPAVAIAINSPGGSPVQSRLVYRRIRDLAAEKGKRVLVFVEDVAASGGYMIACAGDEIIADPSSIVGSIGVVSGGFGFVELIAKLGIERRVHTSGRNKATLDPFRPERPEDVEHLLALQEEVHQTFIDLVKESRGGRLAEHPDLFSGLFWSGTRGRALGLVDEIGDLRSVLRARYGPAVKPVIVQAKSGLFGRRAATGVAWPALAGPPASVGAASREAGEGAAAAIAAIAEERLLWARYGL